MAKASVAKAAKAASKVKPSKLSEADLEKIGGDIYQVTNMIHSILRALRQTAGDDLPDVVPGIEALCEKAGFISDRCARALGEIQVCGPWEEWAKITQHSPAGSVSHG